MTDVIERLRSEHGQECGNCCGTFTGVAMLIEAADVIEIADDLARWLDIFANSPRPLSAVNVDQAIAVLARYREARR